MPWILESCWAKTWICIKGGWSQWPFIEGGHRHAYTHTICSPKPYFLRRLVCKHHSELIIIFMLLLVPYLILSMVEDILPDLKDCYATPSGRNSMGLVRTKSECEAYEWPSLATIMLGSLARSICYERNWAQMEGSLWRQHYKQFCSLRSHLEGFLQEDKSVVYTCMTESRCWLFKFHN